MEKNFGKKSDNMAHKYIAAYYDDNGRPTTADNARKDGARISKRHGDSMVYINQDMLGEPIAVVYPVGDKWVYEPRWGGKSRYFDPKTGKLRGYY